MADMSGSDLQDCLFQRRQSQPLRDLMAQNAMAHRDRVAVVLVFAFTRDDQDQPLSDGLSAKNKSHKFGMRFGQCHPVQVKPPFGLQLAPGHLAVVFLIHLDWRGRQALTNWAQEIVRTARVHFHPDIKRWNRGWIARFRLLWGHGWRRKNWARWIKRFGFPCNLIPQRPFIRR